MFVAFVCMFVLFVSLLILYQILQQKTKMAKRLPLERDRPESYQAGRRISLTITHD